MSQTRLNAWQAMYIMEYDELSEKNEKDLQI